MGAFFGEAGDEAYTVARDGAVFTWAFEAGERRVVRKRGGGKGKGANNKRGQSETSAEEEDEESEEEEEEDEEEEEEDEEEEEEEAVQTKRGGGWKLKTREFLWDPHTQVSSTAFNKKTGLLVVGFDKGAFGLYEMPGSVLVG